MNNYKIIFSIILLLSVMTGCVSDNGYVLYEQNGQQYIYLENAQDAENPTEQIALEHIHFSSFEEMVSDITTGNFSEMELWQIMVNTLYYTDSRNGSLPVCELNTFWEPIYTDTYSRGDILWTGPEYEFIMKGTDGSTVHVVPGIYSKRNLELYTQPMTNYAAYADRLGWIITDIQTDTERNADVYFAENSYIHFKAIVYHITKGDVTYYVYENYQIEKSTSVPEFIDMVVVNGENWMLFKFYDLTERPSLEFLSSFGMQEYVTE